MPDLSFQHLLLFGGFVLPGAISMYVYGLMAPQGDSLLKDKIVEAVCFSIVNFFLMYGLIQFLFEPDFISKSTIWTWLICIVCFILAPVIWPFGLLKLLRLAEQKQWIGVRARTAWDEFFGRKEACWVQITLRNGSVVGGRFSTNSYASSYPEPGHIFVEEMWYVDDNGAFVDPVLGGPGILLRPEDYDHVRVFTDQEVAHV